MDQLINWKRRIIVEDGVERNIPELIAYDDCKYWARSHHEVPREKVFVDFRVKRGSVRKKIIGMFKP